MKAFILALIPSIALASLSPFASTVPGVTIGNTHEVTQGVLRSSEPAKLVAELKEFGVDEVIIFKSQTKTEVDEELKALQALGIAAHHIPFKWKELESAQKACEQLVDALAIIGRSQRAGRTVLFHCTVGEDRTGMLAGLLRMQADGLSAEEAFRDEMCAHGFADGNPKKPWNVSAAIHKELTPLFFALAAKIEAGEALTKKSCKNLAPVAIKRTCRR